MLIISSKDGESILIGDNIVVTIYTGSSNSQIKLGVTTLKEELVLREELVKYRKPD